MSNISIQDINSNKISDINNIIDNLINHYMNFNK